MLKKSIVFVLVLSLFSVAGVSFAKPNFPEGVNPGGHSFSLPANAVEVAPNVFSLGTAYDAQSNSFVEGYAFVHKKENAKNSAAKAPKSPACYGYLANGAKWKGTPEPWIINTSNEDGLSESFVFNTISNDINKWENAAATNILDNGEVTNSVLVADEVAPDGQNEVYFGDLGTNGTIGVTIVWGIFSGPTFNRKLVEWDQVYNTYYDWSASGEASKMDFDNIATHELGHSVGMNDIYNLSCSAVTMYGYANFGETNKSSLEQADITGINNLY